MTTVWQGTIEAAAVDVDFRIGSVSGDNVIVTNTITALMPASGYPPIMSANPVIFSGSYSAGNFGADFNSAWADQGTPAPLQLNPAQTYTLTITTED